jgi:hypothetical protein
MICCAGLRALLLFSAGNGITGFAGDPFSTAFGSALALKGLHVFIQKFGVIEG